MATCRELSEDQDALSRFQHHYWVLEKSATPTALLFPWFPGTAKRNKETATKELYMMIYGYVEARRAAAVPTSDAIDVMISKGMDNDSIIGVRVLFHSFVRLSFTNFVIVCAWRCVCGCNQYRYQL